jgi:hypothetical protein
MQRRFSRALAGAVFLVAIAAPTQTVDSYIHDMNEALAPLGDVATTTCHNLLIDMPPLFGNYAIPDGVDKATGDMTWAVLKLDVLRLYVNLSDIDEDKIQNHAIFSLEYLSKHQKGTPYVPDTPAVMLFTHGLNAKVTVNNVDLDKVHALHGRTDVTESDMGLSIDERKYAIIAFSDQQHADAFQKAVQKAIVLCKAQ